MPFWSQYRLQSILKYIRSEGLDSGYFSVNSIQLPVLAVQELWEINVEDFQIDGYNFVANVRTGSQGGGAGLYLEKNLNNSIT